MENYMENHPIPQDVTGFQFKLIGNMTVKQFVYLAAGVVMGWIFFSLPITAFVKYPIAGFFALCGISLAFVPVAGRPIDIMLGNFIKSLFSPTQYIYRTNAIPQNSSTAPVNTIPVININPDTSTPRSYAQKSLPNTMREEEKENKTLKEKEKTPEKELNAAKSKEENIALNSQVNLELHKKVLSMEDQLREVLTQKQQLSQQIVELEKKLNTQKEQTFNPPPPEQQNKTINVKKTPNNMIANAGLPIASDSPNVIVGTVKDPRGNPLQNILIEIKDKDQNSVRAFKTTVLGQFRSATALPNGTYSIEFDDPKKQNKFETIEVIIKGEIIPPIEVVSVDTREEIRRSLFGQ